MWYRQNHHPGQESIATSVGGVWLQVNKKDWKKRQEGPFETFGGIYGALRLGLRKGKCRDTPWEIQLVHNVDLRKAPPR